MRLQNCEFFAEKRHFLLITQVAATEKRLHAQGRLGPVAHSRKIGRNDHVNGSTCRAASRKDDAMPLVFWFFDLLEKMVPFIKLGMEG